MILLGMEELAVEDFLPVTLETACRILEQVVIKITCMPKEALAF
jgi:hypothetical protein